MAAQREWFEKDYYKVLGVVPTASDKEITRAYRKLAKQYHPDANPGSEEQFKEISAAAYDVVGDADKRKEYDEVRRPRARPATPSGRRGVPAGAPSAFRVDDLGDLLGGHLRRRRRPGPAPSGGPGPSAVPIWRPRSTCRSRTRSTGHHHGQHHQEVHLLHLSRQRRRPGHRRPPARCCGASGWSTTTRACSPSASRCARPAWDAACGSRPLPHLPRAQGPSTRPRSGQGAHPGRGGGRPAHPGQRTGAAGGHGMAPPGDLYVVVHVANRRPVFGRTGRNLTITVPITFPRRRSGRPSPCPPSTVR